MELQEKLRQNILRTVAIVLGVILFCAAILVWWSLPPRTIVMATGAEGGAQHELGLRYREILAESGVTLELRTTAGSIENLQLLLDDKSQVSVGFVQAGTVQKGKVAKLESLGTLFYEPLWLFARSEIGGRTAADLFGRRMSIGPEGSGARVLTIRLIEAVGVSNRLGDIFGFAPQEAGDRLIAGDIDVAFIIGAWESPVVQRLAKDTRVTVHSFPRADAMIAILPYLEKLTLPRGVADLGKNLPPEDVSVLASKASLAIRADLHPSVQQLLLSAATRLHSSPGVFQKAAQFPAAEPIDLPLSGTAQRYYKNGRPFLYNYFPYWLAILVEHLAIIFVPLIAILYPALQLYGRVYNWVMASRISSLYRELRTVENEAESEVAPLSYEEAMEKLDDIAYRVSMLSVPKKYAGAVYTLRAHLDYVRNHLFPQHA